MKTIFAIRLIIMMTLIGVSLHAQSPDNITQHYLSSIYSGIEQNYTVPGYEEYFSSPEILRKSAVSGTGSLDFLGAYYSGNSRSVACSGNTVYLADGGYIRIMDASDPSNLRELSRITPGYGVIVDLECSGDYLYAGSRAFEIYDVSDPTAPRRVFIDGPSGSAGNITIRDNLCFMTWAGCYNAVKIYDITNPTSPDLLNWFALDYMPIKMILSGNNMIIQKSYWGIISSIKFYDISDLLNIQLIADREVGTIDHTMYDMALYSNYLYVTVWQEGVRIFDISNPANPDSLGVYVDGDHTFFELFVFENNLIGHSVHHNRILDISNPVQPVDVGYLGDIYNLDDLEIVGSKAYFADNGFGLRIIDMNEVSSPVVLGGFESTGFVNEITVSDNYLYLAAAGAGLRVVDISDPDNPEEIWNNRSENGFESIEGVCRSGNYLYTYRASGGAPHGIYDISVLDAPEYIKSYSFGFILKMVIAGDYMYAAVHQSEGNIITVIDISDRLNPVKRGELLIPGTVYDIHVSGGFAYAHYSEDFIAHTAIADVSDKDNLELVTSIPQETQFGLYCGLYESEGYLYVADGTEMNIYDVSNPAEPIKANAVNIPLTSIWISGKFAYGGYAHSGGTSVYLFDVSDPENPVYLDGTDNNMTGIRDLHVSGGRIFVANQGSGFSVFTNPAAVTFGDANGGAVVDITDLNEVIHYVLHGEEMNQDQFDIISADVWPAAKFPNFSGPWEINVLDVVSIVNTILGIDVSASVSPKTSSSISLGFDTPRLEEDIIYYPLKLNNATGIAGLELTIDCDNAFTFDKTFLNHKLQDMNVSFGVEEKRLTLLAYSMNKKGLSAHDDVIIELPFRHSGILTRNPVSVTSVIAADRYAGELNVSVDNTIPDAVIAPEKYTLDQNYPNPFNPETSISYSITESGPVTLKVYNTLGQLVKTLVSSDQPPGTYTVQWNGTNSAGSKVSGGIYFYKLQSGSLTRTRKMVLLK